MSATTICFLFVSLLAGKALASPLRKQDALKSLAPAEPEGDKIMVTTHKIVGKESEFSKFGYQKHSKLQKKLAWADFNDGSKGRKCSMAKDSDSSCGALICRQGFCSYCQKDAECPKLNRCVKSQNSTAECEPREEKAWESAISDRHECACTLAILVSAAIAASAGTGGGSIFVPVIISLSQLTEKSAVVALSQFMIFLSSLINLGVFVVRKHPDFPSTPVIDYDCIVVLIPMLCLGVTMGVLVNRSAPSWLVLVLLCGTLCMALNRTASKGLKQLRQEQAMLQNQPSEEVQEVGAASSEEAKQSYGEILRELLGAKTEQVVGIMVCWLIMMASNLHGLPLCSVRYLAFLGIMAGLLIFFAAFMKRRMQSISHLNPIDWLSNSKDRSDWTFPMVALCTGFLGSMLGLGGGILLSPVLMEAGVHPEAVQATTAAFVFLSSSIATIQYVMMGQVVWHYALWYGGIAILATIIGQYLCEVYIRKNKRYSFITLAVAVVLLLSLVCLLCVGVRKVYDDYLMGRPYFFTSEKLCHAAGLGMIIHEPLLHGQSSAVTASFILLAP